MSNFFISLLAGITGFLVANSIRKKERKEIRKEMIGELGHQIDYATKVADNLGTHLDSRFHPYTTHVKGVLDQYKKTPYDDENVQKTL